MGSPVRVDVLTCAYNQERYIAQTIQSVLQQKTDFAVRHIVGDDASRDGTAGIVSCFSEQYPGRILPVLHRRNIGAAANTMTLFKMVDAEYIALCDGDDYWTDSLKLQKQVAFLDDNPDVSGCFHNAIVVDAEDNKIAGEWFDAGKRAAAGDKSRYDQKDCLTLLKHQYPTCSLVFRSQAVKALPAWFHKITSGDFVFDLLVSEYGPLAFLPGNMAAYRVHENGVWQGTGPRQNQLGTLATLYTLYAESHFGRKYAEILKNQIRPRAADAAWFFRRRNPFKAVGYFLMAVRCGWITEKIRSYSQKGTAV